MEPNVIIKEEEKDLSLLFIGDFCPLGSVQEICRSGKSIDRVFSSFRAELGDKDLSIANLECPLTTVEKDDFKGRPKHQSRPGGQ